MKSTGTNSNWSGRTTRYAARIAGASLLAVFLLAPAAGGAAAQEFRLQAEGAGLFWVDEPQGSRFTPGGYMAIRPGIAVGPRLSFQWTYAVLLVAPGDGFSESGTAQFLLAGARVRPLADLRSTTRSTTRHLAGLFVDANLGYVATGDLDRFGFDAGLGWMFQLGSWFSAGPVLRYGQIVQRDDTPGQDPTDAKFLTIGLNLSFGPAPEDVVARVTRQELQPCPVCVTPECPPCVREQPPEADACPEICPDCGGEMEYDADDLCPTQSGSLATMGCPVDPCGGKPLVVLVQFPFDSADLPLPVDDERMMDPVLDAVAAAIAQEPECRVCIVGFASIEGDAEHNMELSSERANAVQQYLVYRGLEEERLPTVGLGDRCQMVPKSTRILNRRVMFLRLDDGESCPTDCPEYRSSR